MNWKISPWKIATLVVLVAAVSYHFWRQPSPGVEPTLEDVVKVRRDQQQQAERLIERISSANKRMYQKGSVFALAIDAATDSEIVDPQPLKAAHADTLAQIRKTRIEFGEYRALDSKSGKALNSAYSKYLNWQEKIYLNDFADLINALLDPESTSLERHNLAFAVRKQCVEDEVVLNKQLNVLQDALRQEHRIAEDTSPR